MKLQSILRRCMAAGAGFAAMVLSASAVFAQGCALCYNNAAATGPKGEAALRHGILVLMIPPMLIFATLIAILYRRRNAYHSAICSVAPARSAGAVSEVVLHLN